MSSEIITFWIGQCGVQMGDACWELLCLEHEMGPNGRFYNDNIPDDNSFKTFFDESPYGQYVPRTILVDLEPTVVDEIRTGVYRDLFHPDYIINGFEDASNNFARGFFKLGKEIIKKVALATRKLAESCNMIQAFVINHSYGGGTGSGFSSMLMEFIAVEFSKISKLQIGLFPSPTLSSAIVEPYNAVLSIHTPMEISDLSMFIDNEAIFNICQKKLNLENAPFTNLNRLQAQVFSGITASFRFQGAINTRLVDLQTNLVPYPRIHFPMISFAPIESPFNASHDNLSVKEITLAVFSKDNQLVAVDPSNGMYMACVPLYRGDISGREIASTLHLLRSSKKLIFADWCPTGFKIGLNYQPMTLVPPSGMAYSSKSVTMLVNSTAIKSIVTGMDRKFLMLFNKRAFVFWYVGEGMEEGEFNEAYDDMMTLEQDLLMLENSGTEERADGPDYEIGGGYEKNIQAASEEHFEVDEFKQSEGKRSSHRTKSNKSIPVDDEKIFSKTIQTPASESKLHKRSSTKSPISQSESGNESGTETESFSESVEP